MYRGKYINVLDSLLTARLFHLDSLSSYKWHLKVHVKFTNSDDRYMAVPYTILSMFLYFNFHNNILR